MLLFASSSPRNDSLVGGGPLEVERSDDDEREDGEGRYDGRGQQRVVVRVAASVILVAVGVTVGVAGRRRSAPVRRLHRGEVGFDNLAVAEVRLQPNLVPEKIHLSLRLSKILPSSRTSSPA